MPAATSGGINHVPKAQNTTESPAIKPRVGVDHGRLCHLDDPGAGDHGDCGGAHGYQEDTANSASSRRSCPSSSEPQQGNRGRVRVVLVHGDRHDAGGHHQREIPGVQRSQRLADAGRSFR
jgi:hypothetical protein